MSNCSAYIGIVSNQRGWPTQVAALLASEPSTSSDVMVACLSRRIDLANAVDTKLRAWVKATRASGTQVTMALSGDHVRETLAQEALAEVYVDLDVQWTVQEVFMTESLDDLKSRMERIHEAYLRDHQG